MSAEAKFIPGPWQYDSGYLFGEDKIRPVCEVFYYGGQQHGESVANAHLIATAPELYEALAAITGETEALCPTEIQEEDWVKAYAALAKARGET